MKRSQIIVMVCLLIAIGIPVVLLMARSHRDDSLEALFTERGFTKLAQCDRSGPLIEGAARIACYRGTVSGASATFAFVTQLRQGYVPKGPHVVGDNYVAVYLDVPRDGIAWPSPRVDSVGGATVLVWETLWSAEEARRRLKELEDLIAARGTN